MTEKQHSTISAQVRAIYLALTCVMVILLAAGICITFSLGHSCMEAGYLKMVTAVVGMLFAALLFACSLNVWDDTQGNTFAAISAMLVLNFLLTGIFDILDGKGGMGTAIFALMMFKETAGGQTVLPLILPPEADAAKAYLDDGKRRLSS